MNVLTLMTRDVATCRASETLAEAADQMRDRDVGALPVLDDTGRVVGMITDRDICMTALEREEPLRAIPVAAAMSGAVVTCDCDDDLAIAEARMADHQLRRIPVVDDQGYPLGIVSLNDLARAIALRSEISTGEVAATLAAVCSPRSPVSA
jgi:CBS domain-containing protein